MRTELRPQAVNDDDRRVATQIPSEPLREQLFAAFGYTFAAVGLVLTLFTPHLGRLDLIAGIALAGALVTVNLALIRRFARLRRFFASQDAAAHPAQRRRAGARQRASRN